MDLDPAEIRVLGCLVEKEMTTPQAYPLTLNSLRLACNQSTNRDPVVVYDDHVVELALGRLRERGLTRVVHSPSNRVPKYRHVIGEAWALDSAQQAVLAVLALRGPQTLGELKARTERMHPFADLAEVDEVLAGLAAAEPEALARRLDRRPGQKDARYVALLGGTEGLAGEAALSSPEAGPHHFASPTPDPGSPEPARGVASDGEPSDAPELAAIRAELAQLRSDLDGLVASFETFRQQFN